MCKMQFKTSWQSKGSAGSAKALFIMYSAEQVALLYATEEQNVTICLVDFY